MAHPMIYQLRISKNKPVVNSGRDGTFISKLGIVLPREAVDGLSDILLQHNRQLDEFWYVVERRIRLNSRWGEVPWVFAALPTQLNLAHHLRTVDHSSNVGFTPYEGRNPTQVRSNPLPVGLFWVSSEDFLKENRKRSKLLSILLCELTGRSTDQHWFSFLPKLPRPWLFQVESRDRDWRVQQDAAFSREKIPCSLCGDLTSIDLLEDDGSPRICSTCEFEMISPGHGQPTSSGGPDLNDIIENQKDQADQDSQQ